jgi:alkanesulfonate monooxygenase SsuD/methylene tetrahydromethanopterin reductase-like flavin-dependent oxidoreductase (luciferase family)
VESMDAVWSNMEREMATSMSSMAFIGSKESVKEQLESFQEKYNVNEIMAVSYIYDPKKQIRSYEIFKEIVDGR